MVLFALVIPLQARIQDFEMGGEFSPTQSEKSEKSNIFFQYLRNKKKKRKKGAQKKGVKIHPFHLPWIRACCSDSARKSGESRVASAFPKVLTSFSTRCSRKMGVSMYLILSPIAGKGSRE